MSEEREQLEARIAAYIDGELPEAEAARLEVFLANTDPQLAEQVIGMMTDKNRLRTLPREKAPVDLAARIMEQVERATLLNDVEHIAPPRRSWWQSRISIAAAVLILVGGFGALVIHSLMRPPGNEWSTQLATVQKKNAPPGVERPAAGPESQLAMGARKEGAELRSLKDADKPLASAAPASPMPAPVMAAPTGGVAGKAAGADESVDRATVAKALKSKAPEDAEAVEIAKEEQVQDRLAKDQSLVQNGTADAGGWGYVSADTAAKALTAMSVRGSMANEPIVVTLVARDNQDAGRLKTAIAGFINSDPTLARNQVSVQNRLWTLNNASNPTRANGNFDGNGNSYTGGATVSGRLDLSGSNSYNPTNSPATNPASANITVNGAMANSGSNPNFYNNDAYQVYNGGRFDQVEMNQRSRQAQSQVGSNPISSNDGTTPYRVLLREDQLQQLTGEFQVYTLSCGRQAFLISETQKYADAKKPDDGALRGAVAFSKDAAANEKLEMSKTGSSQLAAAKPSGAGAIAPTGSGSPLEQSAADHAKQQGAGEQASADAGSLHAAQQAKEVTAEGNKSRVYDCVIRMEPRPVQPNAAPLMNQQAK